MGAIHSRSNGGVEEVDIASGNAYRYPPKSGNYFGSHYIMGGDRFETAQPEAYLFGENEDLNFLGNRPIPFPYPAPQAHEPTKTLKSLVNIRKDSIRFIKAPEDPYEQAPKGEQKEGSEPKMNTRYNLEFVFDTDVNCAITVYYFASEEIVNKSAVYHSKEKKMISDTYHYKKGANQTFSQTSHVINPSKFPEEEWQYNPDKEVIPIVIQCVVEDEEHAGHSHMTFCISEKTADGSYVVKSLKQKQMIDGLCYLLQEIYGIENKNSERNKDDELDDNGSECVICMCEMRDTVILPCRHLCLCNCCADNLRYQANNCPICRAPFRALLQIRAMKKKNPQASPQSPTENSEEAPCQDGVPPGYEAISLIEALNGPLDPPSSSQPTLPPDGATPVASGSLAGTPEPSPLMDKKKMKRNASGRSNKSTRSNRSNVSQRSTGTSSIEHAEEAVAALSVVETVGISPHAQIDTPDVEIITPSKDCKKSPATPKRIKTPNIKYPAATLVLDDGDMGNRESVEIVDEVESSKVILLSYT